MKTFALVEASSIRHMVNDREAAEELRADAAARGVRLILMRPQEHIEDAERFEAIAADIRAGGGGPGNQDQWSLIMSSLDALKAAVAKNTTVVESALTAFAGLAEKLKTANVDNTPEINALAAEITADADKLAAAVAVNTPAVKIGEAEPAPVDAPPGDPTTDTPSA